MPDLFDMPAPAEPANEIMAEGAMLLRGAAPARDNPDKALVMKYIGRLVADGYAEWSLLDNGEVEVRFTSGETYLLAETTILRLA